MLMLVMLLMMIVHHAVHEDHCANLLFPSELLFFALAFFDA